MPNQIRGPLMSLPVRRTTWSAVYPLLIKYSYRYPKERIGQGPQRPQLYTGGPTSPDPWGLRDGNPPRPPVQRHDGVVGDAVLRTPPLRGCSGQERPLLPRHRTRERDLRP